MVDTFKNFLDRWFTPATLVAIAGLIIWGAQTNVNIINLTKALAAQQVKVDSIATEHRNYELSMVKATIIQQELLKKLEITQKQVLDHQREAEQWKRKIIRNEEIINGLAR
jgi:hypothetical protein